MKMVYADAFMRTRIDRENELYRIFMQTAPARNVRKISMFRNHNKALILKKSP